MICFEIIIFLVIIFNITNYFYDETLIYPQTFNLLYSKEENILKYQYNELMGCMNKEPFYNCMKNDKEIYKTKYSKDYYKKHPFNLSFYDNINLNYNVLIHPKDFNSYINVIVVIPISPSQLLPRIAIRKTYHRISKSNNYRYKYIFVMGRPDCSDEKNNKRSTKYPFNYLKEESNYFNDMLVFNYTNSYKLITFIYVVVLFVIKLFN